MTQQDAATRIADLFAEDLDIFLKQQLKKRSLNELVVELNESALSKTDPNSPTARAALKKLGFPD